MEKTIDNWRADAYNIAVQAEAARFSHAAGIYAGAVKATNTGYLQVRCGMQPHFLFG